MAEILIILGLILLNGVFAMAEIALVSARKARLEAQANKGDARAKEALALANHPDKFISTTQIGITLIGILNGIFSGENIKGGLVEFFSRFETFKPYSNGLATTVVVIIITYFSLVLGELVPKRIGLSNPEGIAKALAAPMRVLTYITYPFIWFLTKSSSLLIRLFNIKKDEGHVTEEEIKAIISEGTEQGTIDEAEQEIIERVFHLGDRNITSLMTHRSDIVWLDMNSKVAGIKELSDEMVHSIYPVCDGTIDAIKGVASLKDIFRVSPETLVKEVMKPAFYVPENNSAYQLLEKFKQTRMHYAFIVDEYGTLQGIITLNNILEAIVGDISEPHEEDYEIVEREDGSYLIDAQIPYYNFLSYFNKTDWIDEEQEFDTLAGFILDHLERIPVTGDKLDWRGFGFEIVDMDNHRIDKLLVTISEKLKAELEEE
ncbi:HlyC/CorC family transporter [Panacibacter ginsenosidivorans]|uniref:HlyC/CorC family transporter n=1 Tax=Panacibacter ginsenosidivorans TaxID=1813871 RepID=A0A5B8V3U2_9BACT|nr:hemolysin family protein [Panacibacter ginsenosidivorans]QEC65872.1 HlyC/CorC family transporter [Panacibacter ginsenosidivorans]